MIDAHELIELQRHDDHRVRELVELVRETASQLLLSRMRDAAREYLGDRDDFRVSQILWTTIEEGGEKMPEEDVHEIERLARLSDSWWVLRQNLHPEQVDLDEWRQRYQEMDE